MKLDIRSPQGIHAAEHKAITELAAGLRPAWHGYASFLIADKAGSMEIDLLIFTHSRILLVEIKHWSGSIASDGKNWIQTAPSGYSRSQASPVSIKREHAERLKSLFDKHLQSRWNGYYPIETCIVLSGQATITQMPDWEREMVFTLKEFLEIRTEAGFERLLPKREHEYRLKSGKLARPNTERQIAIFENWLKGGGCVKARQREAGGYVMTEPQPIFSHRGGVYAEYIGVHRTMENNQAVLRAWNFNQLGSQALTQEQRAFYGLREQRAINFVGQKNHQLRKDYLMQPQQQLVEEQVTEDLIEVYEKPPLFERLDAHLTIVPHEKTARLELLRALLDPFARLHQLGLAHRDIAHERLYYNSQSQSITVSGLVAARFPDVNGRSIGDVRRQLATSSVPLPEEVYGETDIDACRLDVYLLGVVAYRIAFNTPLPFGEDGVIWQDPLIDPFEGQLHSWLKQSLSMEPASRQADAGEMLSQLTQLFVLDSREVANDEAEIISSLEAYRSPINLMLDFPPTSAPTQDLARNRMSYRSTYEGRPVVVRIWAGLQPQNTDKGLNRRLLRFIERCQSLKQHSLPTAPVVDFGLSMMGLYTIQSYIEEGQQLTSWLESKSKEVLTPRFEVANDLISGINQLHALGLGHGDLKPDNLLVTEVNGQIGLYFLDTLDLDINGLPMQNHEYRPLQDVSSLARDRFATYLIIDELFAGCGGQTELIRKEIRNGLGSELTQVPLSLEPLRDSLQRAAEQPLPKVEPLNLHWPNLLGDNGPQMLETDQGRLYLAVRTLPEFLQLFITGLKQKLILEAKWEGQELVLCKVRIKNISPAEFMRDAQQAANPKRHQHQIFEQPLKLQNGERITKDEASLMTILAKISAVAATQPPQTLGAKTSLTNDFERPFETNDRVDLHRLWSALVDAERDLHPTVTVASAPQKQGEIYLLQIQEDLTNFDSLDVSDQIQLMTDSLEDKWNYGTVDLSRSQGDMLAVMDARSMGFLRPGTRLKLVEVRSETSWQRRRQALQAVLQHETLIPSLVSWFDPTQPNPTPAVAPLPQPEDQVLASYGLDESKATAFRYVLNQPLSVVMGPPGTGKTTMLSALLDYLCQQPSVGRILLVSQSHVAVNELAVRTRQVMRRRLEANGLSPSIFEPSMVRLGDRQKIDDELLDVHVESLQARYRTAFHRNLDSRLLALAARMRLPNALVADVGDLYRRFGTELYQYIKAREELERLQSKMEELDERRRPQRDFEKTRSRLKRLYDALSHGLLAYTDLPQPLLEADDPMQELLELMAEKHQIYNPQSLLRLRGVLDTSHNWMLRLSADADGFAGFAARTRKLVIGTLVGIGKGAYNLAQNTYDIVIIDEAGRATASELAIAMQSARRVILVGDHKQLPPMNDPSLVRQVSQKLGLTLQEVLRTDFERAFISTQGAMLNMQYRMAPAIGDLISRVFYDGKLNTGRSPAEAWMKDLPKPWNRTVTWLDSSKSYEDDLRGTLTLGGSRKSKPTGARNSVEVDLICMSLRRLIAHPDALEQLHTWASEDNAPPIGIITGYRRQVQAIRARLDTDSWADGIRNLVRIDTIDSYQGSENRIIILSLVRNNKADKAGFIDDAPRINVAISRAKERLLILGAISFWGKRNNNSPLGNVYRYISSAIERGHPEYQKIQPEQLAIESQAATLKSTTTKQLTEAAHD
ncbi:AAA domain-containing protein [Aeromonas veronii]|uniref:AAA domain-containing protein n=1 Tax=Aeromonas veronii TaxID=654 RepID=UPI0032EC0A46